MSKIYFIYNIIFTLLAPVLFVYTLLNDHKLDRSSLLHRFGVIDNSLFTGLSPDKPRVWIHAVSVGEINAITGFIDLLDRENPDLELIISTLTATGQEVAREKLADRATIIYLPFDFIWAARRIMNLLKPAIFITIETEIWPNMLREAAGAGAEVVMINGRISPRSYGKYRRLKPFMERVLANYDAMSMIMPHDADRIKNLGAVEEKVIVNGNSKYDHLADQVDFTVREEVYDLFNIKPGTPVFIAGSTRTGEEEKILAVYRKLLSDYPELLLIIAPRHIKRGAGIKQLASDYGFNAILKTEIDEGRERKEEKVIILNTIGELFTVYAIGTVVFCGASLVPKGGQNIMEPAVWGKPVFYGPSMEDFIDARYLLEDVGAGIQVNNQQELYRELLALLDKPDRIKKLGKRAREAVLANRGASARNARLVTEMVS